jgi:aminoglycoside phosphotransferase family enzyme
LIRELLRPEAFPHAVHGLALRETHISWVVLTGAFAYKIKKPVKLEFIDASTLEQRRHYCEEELRLNRRFGPDLYIDVVAITCDGGHALVGGHGPAAEYAVRMRQFAADDELPCYWRATKSTLRRLRH